MSNPCEKAETIDHMAENVDRLNHAVFGNGDPGIRANLLLVTQQQQTHGREIRDIKDLQKWALLGIAASFGAVILQMIFK